LAPSATLSRHGDRLIRALGRLLDDQGWHETMIVPALLFGLAGALVAAFGLYLAVLAAASAVYSQRLERIVPRSRLAVLIPAHDEELLVARVVASLLTQTYPRHMFRIVVIADNCDDETAAVAARAGADDVLVRVAPDARGKGRALRWAMDEILAARDAPDAIVSIDADSIADPDMLLALVERFEAGAEAVQSDYRAMGDGSTSATLREAAFILMNRVRPAGRNVLGMSGFLTGNGWLLSSDLLRRRPWAAFSSTEDREYSLDLEREGVSIAFAGAAGVRAPTAPNHEAAATQQERWEGGWATLLRTRGPELLAHAAVRRSPRLLLAVFDLAVPPMGLLTAAAVAGLAVAAGAAVLGAWSAWVVLPWFVAVGSVAAYVIGGLVANGAPISLFRALLHAPRLVAAKPFSLRRTLKFHSDTWVRTERTGSGLDS
jgi:1,2-diacylglycerol 3-beta-glucosyltransferase